MKTLKSLFSIMLIGSVLIFASCSKSGDPAPVVTKTDLQKIQEAVAGSTWTLTNAKIETSTNTYNYNANCDFSTFPSTALASNTNDINYTFTTDGKLSWINHCDASQFQNNLSYTITQTGSTFSLVYTQGSSPVTFQFVTAVGDITNPSVIVTRSPLFGGATKATLTFSKTK